VGWWKATGLTHFADGHSTFNLAPIAVNLPVGHLAPINVLVTSARPVTANGLTTIAVTLGGSFKGNCGWTIYTDTDGHTLLQSHWTNMAPQGSVVLMGGMAIKAHWMAEDNALKNLNSYLNGRQIFPLSVSDVLHNLFK